VDSVGIVRLFTRGPMVVETTAVYAKGIRMKSREC